MRRWLNDRHFKSLLKNSGYLAVSKAIAAVAALAAAVATTAAGVATIAADTEAGATIASVRPCSPSKRC